MVVSTDSVIIEYLWCNYEEPILLYIVSVGYKACIVYTISTSSVGRALFVKGYTH